ncbi:MAG: hypothetical protein AABX53_01700 [Nanoarchaeota archaeon]
MKPFFLASVLATAGVLSPECSPPSDSSSPVQAPASVSSYILPIHGEIHFSPSLDSGRSVVVSTSIPLDAMLGFFESSSLAEPDARKLLASHNLEWGVPTPGLLRFESSSFIYGSPLDPHDNPNPTGSYRRSDLLTSDISAIVEGRRPRVEFYPVTGEFTAHTRQNVTSQLPSSPVYVLPGDMVAQATNRFPSGAHADAVTYNHFLAEQVKQSVREKPDLVKNLAALIAKAQKSAPEIGRYKGVPGGDRFRTYDLLTGNQYGVVVRGLENPTQIEQVYVMRFDRPQVLYPSLDDSSPASMEKTLSKRGLEGDATYCGRKVDVRYLK